MKIHTWKLTWQVPGKQEYWRTFEFKSEADAKLEDIQTRIPNVVISVTEIAPISNQAQFAPQE